MNNDNIFEKVKMKIAISQVIKEEDIDMNKNKSNIIKNIGIAACILLSTTGVVFAGNKIIEKIWKKPEKVQVLTDNITEESKKENITEEKAKEIAINQLKEIGFNYNIVNTNHNKRINSSQIDYRFVTEDNYEITINGQTGEFYQIWNNKDKQDENVLVTEDEAIEIANKYCEQFGYNKDEYEITHIYSNNKDGSGKGPGFKIDITYNKRYGDIYNPYEYIYISINSKSKTFDCFRVENIPFDNNETIITKEEATQIALKEDEKIETNKVIETKVEKRVVKMNANAYDRINNKEKFYESMQTIDYPTEERNYYEVQEKIRNAWVVVITYEDNYGGDIVKRYTEGQYSYFVDCTTGEIIGGAIMDYIVSN